MSIKIESSIEGIVTCAQFDHTGKKLAAYCSESELKIYNYSENSLEEVCVLQHIKAEVLSLSWSHPKFGSMLATCGSDHKIVIWKEHSSGVWGPMHEHTEMVGVNCVSWGPWELGMKVLAGLEDGNVLIMTFTEEWDMHKFKAHNCAIKVIEWGRAFSFVSLSAGITQPETKFAVGASDGKIKHWSLQNNEFVSESLDRHAGCVRDISWNPNISDSREFIASCADRNVIIWSRNTEDLLWKLKDILDLPGAAWKVTWNPQGNLLAVSFADNMTRIYKEISDDTWKVITTINQKGIVINNNDG